jgi:hypothetical protein
MGCDRSESEVNRKHNIITTFIVSEVINMDSNLL